MKNICLLILLVTVSLNSFAQDSTQYKLRYREIHISSNTLLTNWVTVHYKQQLFNNIFLKVSNSMIYHEKIIFNPIISTAYRRSDSNTGADINLGIERRNSLTEKFYIFYGIDFSLRAGINTSKVDNPTLTEKARKSTNFDINGYSIFLNLGFMFEIKENLFLGASFSPRIYFENEKLYNFNTNKSFYAVLNSDALAIQLCYRWAKKKK